MTAVFVLRHPQTTWNRAERYQGRLDAPLSDEGWSQAMRAAHSFRDAQLDAVYASPLSRARALAEQLADATSAPLRTDARLTEMAQGPWEGLYLNQIRRRFSHLYTEWYSRPDLVRFPGGEALSDVCRRALSALCDIYRSFPAGRVAVVTHSVVAQVLAATCLHLDLRFLHHIRISNASVTTIYGQEVPGVLLSLNVTEPLYRSPVRSAESQAGAGQRPRRITT